MDFAFISGLAATISSILVFCGSVWLLLTLIMGARLAYFITASITLAFVLIMGVVWSINPLGPVGELPEWLVVDAGEDSAQLEFGAAGDYPEEPWQPKDEEDTVQVTQAAELEGAALEEAERLIGEEKLDVSLEATATVNGDLTRLLQQGETQYGAATIEVTEEDAQDPTSELIVIAEYDPGNPLGKARSITLGTFVVFVLHLFGLGRAERHARRERDAADT